MYSALIRKNGEYFLLKEVNMKAVQQKWFVIVELTIMLCLAGLVMSGTAFAQQCVDNGDGTVTDNATGLMWQKATAGSMDWDTAMSYASGLSLGGHSGWRLPNKDELYWLYNSPCRHRMDVTSIFYWSSNSRADIAWLIVFNYGYVSHGYKSESHYVRAVRGVQ